MEEKAKLVVTVTECKLISETVKYFQFELIDGSLPEFSPGSHVTVSMQNGELQRSYSLLSAPTNTRFYAIAVHLNETSKGGSHYMHNNVKVGDTLDISEPENYFPLVENSTKKHILIAGGIGITPFLSYLHTLQKGAFDFELHYCFRQPNTAGFISELKEQLGDKLFLYNGAQQQRINIAELMSTIPADSHCYVCGPDTLIDEVIERGKKSFDDEYIHFEKFTESIQTGHAFDVHCKRSNITLRVEEDMSILQALEADARINIECLCRNGVCGTCETTILEGEAEHHDLYLSEEEQQEQSTMMVCVSRARSARLVLDL